MSAAPLAPPLAAADELLSEQPDSLAVGLRLEAMLWAEIDAIQALASKLREREVLLPAGLLCLWPMQQQHDQQQEQQEQQVVAAGGDGGAAEARHLQVGAHPDYPALRRLQHLSYAVLSQLANVSASEGRQAFVEAPSVCARLRLGLASLNKHRQVLAAFVAVEGL